MHHTIINYMYLIDHVCNKRKISPTVVLMLGQCRRRWPSIGTTVSEHAIFLGYPQNRGGRGAQWYFDLSARPLITCFASISLIGCRPHHVHGSHDRSDDRSPDQAEAGFYGQINGDLALGFCSAERYQDPRQNGIYRWLGDKSRL